MGRSSSTGNVVVVDGCAALVALIEVVFGRAGSIADSDSGCAASISLAVTKHIHVCQAGTGAAVQGAAHIETVAARELLVVEEQSLAALKVLGVLVVCAVDGLGADVVVAA